MISKKDLKKGMIIYERLKQKRGDDLINIILITDILKCNDLEEQPDTYIYTFIKAYLIGGNNTHIGLGKKNADVSAEVNTFVDIWSKPDCLEVRILSNE